MSVSLIVAMSQNRVIGRGGALPWRLSADLQRFKKLTMGHHIVMGRKTFESIGRPLAGRKMIVVTRQEDYCADHACVAHSLPQAIEIAQAAGDEEVFITGGSEIYRQGLEVADRVYLTLVHAEVDGDAYFPEIDVDRWRLTGGSHHAADERNEFDYSFRVYETVDIAQRAPGKL